MIYLGLDYHPNIDEERGDLNNDDKGSKPNYSNHSITTCSEPPPAIVKLDAAENSHILDNTKRIIESNAKKIIPDDADYIPECEI